MSAMIGTVFRVDPSLREGIVWRTLNRLAGAGRPEPLERHHERAGALYDIDDPGAREVAFARLAETEFVALDLLAPVEEALAERPVLATRFGTVLVGEAQGRAQEGVTCDGERNLLGFRVLPSRFDDGAALHGWCRHALGHAEDTLDPAFDFVPGWDTVPGAGGVAGRLHALWDVSVDGRAESAGYPVPGADPRRHEAAIAAMLPPAHAPAATAVVERLWSGPRPTFHRLFDWAEHVELLADAVGYRIETEAGLPLPAGRCPLCTFPSEDLRVPGGEPAARVAAEYPDWRPAQGLCGRCTDRYLFAISAGGRA